MGIKKTLAAGLASVLLALAPAKAPAQSIEFGLFPEMPIYRSIMVDPDIPKTEIRTTGNLVDLISNTPWNALYPNTTLAKTLPLLSIDLKNENLPKSALSASLVASGQTGFPDGDTADYKGRLELFVNSPMVDTYLSDGNRLYLVGGIEKNGSVKLNELQNETIPSVFQKLYDNFSGNANLFADLYIVPRSPYSNQYLILRAGFGNLLSDNPFLYASTTWEFPSIFNDSFLNGIKASPYISLYMGSLLKNFQTNGNQTQAKQYGFSAQAGLKIYGKSGAAAIIYEELSGSTNQEPLILLSGLKLEM